MCALSHKAMHLMLVSVFIYLSVVSDYWLILFSDCKSECITINARLVFRFPVSAKKLTDNLLSISQTSLSFLQVKSCQSVL